ncbi:hypothetical protein DIT71_00030 [Marinobacter vulgaris]|uniref:TnsA endonuclease N-terminal domain-containing protein n=1 Tax=Marinobacter vulgaris TaxID=1928331 RepID=A0A2V3ZNY6_9GAMM|nr:TnsA endonuclease N-terminal domain-containing protein [Marinobacter vulgaris]PXX93234.1 hypothetical protein DIT71_00030 [Marinobacter vulgaris]TSJ72754.1 hypothetical protein FPC41_03235 [Marinobacter vulgaris]
MKQRELAKQSPIRSSYLSYSAHYDRVFAVESTLELDYLNLVRFERKADRVESQPFSIQFHLRRRPRRYTPDFLVVEGGVEYVDEIKTAKAANQPEFCHKASKLTRYFAERGQVFRIFTENDIRIGYRAQNIRFLAPVLDTSTPMKELATLLNASSARSASMSGLREYVSYLEIEPSFVRRAVAHRLISCDLTKPWSELELHW